MDSFLLQQVLRSSIAPIRALPVELLAEIFMLAVHDHVTYFRGYVKAAYVLSYVCCSDWRHVADATPQLWAAPTVWIDLERCGSDAHVDGSKAWLERIRAPVSFSVDLKTSREANWDAFPPRMMEMLSFAPQWRSLTLTSNLVPLFHRIAECQLDALEEMEAPVYDAGPGLHDSGFEFEPLPIVPFTTPGLRRLVMPVDAPFNIPWAQLTDLELSGSSSAKTLLDILAKNNILTLPHLRVLSLHNQEYLELYLNGLDAPALEQFSLYHETYTGWPRFPFAAFQYRSPNITHLSLEGIHVTWDDLHAALLRTPSLTYLRLHEREDGLLHALYYRDGDVAPLLPCLHDLLLKPSDQLPEDGLMRAVVSRWWTEADLAHRSAPPAVARWIRINLRGL
ncbi:hypothetical protein B0H19DRAFT_1249442 [Mycena capillaripes]|nr:hypothetical protein B0H19DRAFT_1249442 [Mycena capillaripes]